MGLIAKLLDSFVGNSGEPAAKVEIYQNDNANARIFNPPGVDSRPLDNDDCFTEDSEDTEGGKDILGFIDPNNDPVAEKGENRFYSRDDSGIIIAVIYLKKDGKIIIEGPGGVINFDLLKHTHLGNLGYETAPPTITGAEIPPLGIPPTLDANNNIVDGNGTKSTEHIHSQGNDAGGDTEVDTGDAQ